MRMGVLPQLTWLGPRGPGRCGQQAAAASERLYEGEIEERGLSSIPNMHLFDLFFTRTCSCLRVPAACVGTCLGRIDFPSPERNATVPMVAPK
jgi:hypothetical protein